MDDPKSVLGRGSGTTKGDAKYSGNRALERLLSIAGRVWWKWRQLTADEISLHTRVEVVDEINVVWGCWPKEKVWHDCDALLAYSHWRMSWTVPVGLDGVGDAFASNTRRKAHRNGAVARSTTGPLEPPNATGGPQGHEPRTATAKKNFVRSLGP